MRGGGGCGDSAAKGKRSHAHPALREDLSKSCSIVSETKGCWKSPSIPNMMDGMLDHLKRRLNIGRDMFVRGLKFLKNSRVFDKVKVTPKT